MNIDTQTDSSFGGTLDFISIDGNSLAPLGIVITSEFDGTIVGAGQGSGTFETRTVENDILTVISEGTFSVTLVGTTLTGSYSGQNTFGESCSFTGSFSGSQVGA